MGVPLYYSFRARILEPIDSYKEVVPIVLQHHERYDGKGYPDGRSGEIIHPGARILAVADVFDAMLSNRPYRIGLALNDVVNTIKQGAGQQFDPRVVDVFLSIVSTEDRIMDMWDLPADQEKQWSEFLRIGYDSGKRD